MDSHSSPSSLNLLHSTAHNLFWHIFHLAWSSFPPSCPYHHLRRRHLWNDRPGMERDTTTTTLAHDMAVHKEEEYANDFATRWPPTRYSNMVVGGGRHCEGRITLSYEYLDYIADRSGEEAHFCFNSPPINLATLSVRTSLIYFVETNKIMQPPSIARSVPETSAELFPPPDHYHIIVVTS